MKVYRKEFSQQALPSNIFAFRHSVFLNPFDFEDLKIQQKKESVVYVEIKGFIVQVEELKDINEGNIGISSLFRSMMEISKIDKVFLKLA